MSPRPDRQSGFTLVELLVVVIVIGILAAIAIPTFLNAKSGGYVASVTADMRQVQLELEGEVARSGSYAALDGLDEAGLVSHGINPGDATRLRVVADASSWCIEGTDVRLDGRRLVMRSGTPGIDTQAAAGC